MPMAPGRRTPAEPTTDEAARALIIRNNCEIVVISMGPMGAMLVTSDYVEHIPAPPVPR